MCPPETVQVRIPTVPSYCAPVAVVVAAPDKLWLGTVNTRDPLEAVYCTLVGVYLVFVPSTLIESLSAPTNRWL